MRLRQFNSRGIDAFRAALEACRENAEAQLPESLLSDENLSSAVEPVISIENRRFLTKAEAAVYLREALSAISDASVATNAGLWTWLSAYYFDEVCPSVDGKRAVKNDYHYIFEPHNPRHFYRHLL